MAENNYVKFLRGTSAGYGKLASYDANTLYFVIDDDADFGKLYLGDTLLAADTLAKLTDVTIDTVANKNVLGYDSASQTWKPMTVEEAMGESFIKPTQIFEVSVAAGADHVSAINTAVGTKELQAGDIAIVKEAIANGKQQYTSYVYDGAATSWAAMDGNYNASNVYFDEDLTYTANIGALTLSGANFRKISSTGKSLEAVLKEILAKTDNPTITPASYSLKAAAPNTGASLEIGSYVNSFTWDGTFTDGSYSYGSKEQPGSKAAGLTATYSVTSDIAAAVAVNNKLIDGTFNVSNNAIQIDSTGTKTYATITGVCTVDYTHVRTPINNVGDEVTGKLTTPTTITKTASLSLTGYRNSWYYIGTDCTTNIDSAFVRDEATPKNANTKSFGTLTIPAGTKRIMFAVPGSATLSSVIDVDGMGLDVKGNFTTKTVSIEGANGFTAASYTIFVAENPNGLAATHYTITIK